MKLNIIGCGRLGKPIGKILAASDVIKVGGVVNQSNKSAEEAVAFLGCGTVYDKIGNLPSADATMIACNDDSIQTICNEAVGVEAILEDSIVFHCSGAQSSNILSSASSVGAHVGSLHPMKSFADPERSFASLKGVYCGIEGDEICRDFLTSAVEKSGMKPFFLDSESKIFYHAGAVIMCNYLVSLLEAGYRCFEEAGVDRELAAAITTPFIEGTLKNVLQSGTVDGLTGPIARGDKRLVEYQFQKMKEKDSLLGEMYSTLGRIAVQLSRQQGSAAENSLATIEALFARDASAS